MIDDVRAAVIEDCRVFNIGYIEAHFQFRFLCREMEANKVVDCNGNDAKTFDG